MFARIAHPLPILNGVSREPAPAWLVQGCIALAAVAPGLRSLETPAAPRRIQRPRLAAGFERGDPVCAEPAGTVNNCTTRRSSPPPQNGNGPHREPEKHDGEQETPHGAADERLPVLLIHHGCNSGWHGFLNASMPATSAVKTPAAPNHLKDSDRCAALWHLCFSRLMQEHGTCQMPNGRPG